MNRLALRIDSSRANHPKVRLLIDGEDLLASTGSDEANDPGDILDTGALLPQDPPRRIAFYGCGCGVFGCGNVAGLIVERGDQVQWTDFLSLTGVYESALPDPEDGRDPAELPWDWPLARHDLPTFTFDRADYLATVEDAMADRSWETRTRAVLRHLRASGPEAAHWAARDGEAITLHHRVDDKVWAIDLLLPPGTPERLAGSLRSLLDAGVDPRRIAAEQLWRKASQA